MNKEDVALLQLLESCTGARAFPVGSAAILGSARSAESDFDILMVGTEDSEVVFQALEQLEVEWSRRVEGKFRLLKMQIGSSQLDIEYAKSSNPKHPILWSDIVCEEGGQSVAALCDSHAIRSAIIHARGFQGWLQFKQALILVKAWAQIRGINSNALGYLGSFAWSLLLANTALASDAPSADDFDGTALALAQAMWKRFATWSWPQPVGLEAVKVASKDLMPILCPTDSLPTVLVTSQARV